MPQKEDFVEPTMWESGMPIGKDLDAKVPTKDHAAREAVKYGDVKTAGDMGDAGRAIQAVFAVSDKSSREHRDSKVIKHGTPTNEQRFKP